MSGKAHVPGSAAAPDTPKTIHKNAHSEAAERTMRVDIYFDQLGEDYRCCSCGTYLKREPTSLAHPTYATTLLLKKKRIECEFAGQLFVHPFRNVELKRVP